jgi:3-methyladenine DNA glycosylase AlkC
MADPMKDALDRDVVEAIAASIATVHPRFPARAFVADALEGLAALELLARAAHVGRALRRHLPPSYEEALAILVRSLGPPLSESDAHDGLGQGLSGFAYLPHVAFVRDHGLERFDASMAAQRELTRRFTAEWSIRPFLAAEPARTFAVLRRWVEDPSPHVRRLVSEGTRPRLPWAPRAAALVADPAPALALLELLRDDPSPYVRRSVANHLNDVSRDHPELLLRIAKRWLRGATPARRRLVRHALRTLVKAGNPEALALLGFEGGAEVAVSAAITPARVPLGGSVRVAATVTSRARAPRALVVDLAVHFVKARGAPRAKVFKGRELRLAPGEEGTVGKTISLAALSTRRHFVGRHQVDVLVNGKVFPAGEFEVLASRAQSKAPPAAARGPRRLSRRAR